MKGVDIVERLGASEVSVRLEARIKNLHHQNTRILLFAHKILVKIAKSILFLVAECNWRSVRT